MHAACASDTDALLAWACVVPLRLVIARARPRTTSLPEEGGAGPHVQAGPKGDVSAMKAVNSSPGTGTTPPVGPQASVVCPFSSLTL